MDHRRVPKRRRAELEERKRQDLRPEDEPISTIAIIHDRIETFRQQPWREPCVKHVLQETLPPVPRLLFGLTEQACSDCGKLQESAAILLYRTDKISANFHVERLQNFTWKEPFLRWRLNATYLPPLCHGCATEWLKYADRPLFLPQDFQSLPDFLPFDLRSLIASYAYIRPELKCLEC